MAKLTEASETAIGRAAQSFGPSRAIDAAFRVPLISVQQVMVRIARAGGLLGALVTSVCCAASMGGDAAVAPAEWIDDLRPITAAEWTPERAAHLVERTGFGALPTEVHHSLTLDPRAVVAALIRPKGADDPSVRAFEPSGPEW